MGTFDMEQILDRLAFSEEIAKEGGRIALRHFLSDLPDLAVRNKDPLLFDPVTRADEEAEMHMRSLILSKFPEDKVLGEEFGVTGTAPDVLWTLDPIDGTRSFISGSPLWGTLVSFSLNGKPIVGTIEMPALKERFSGAKDSAVWQRNGGFYPMKTRKCPDIESAIAAVTSPYQFRDRAEREALHNLTQKVRLVRFGGDCYNYGLLAAGLLDVVMEADLKPEDVHALIPVIESSGGTITTWDGKDPWKGGRILATGDDEMHVRMLELLSKNID